MTTKSISSSANNGNTPPVIRVNFGRTTLARTSASTARKRIDTKHQADPDILSLNDSPGIHELLHTVDKKITLLFFPSALLKKMQLWWLKEAEAMLLRAISGRPGYASAMANLGVTLQAMDKVSPGNDFFFVINVQTVLISRASHVSRSISTFSSNGWSKTRPFFAHFFLAVSKFLEVENLRSGEKSSSNFLICYFVRMP